MASALTSESDQDFSSWLRRRRDALLITQEILADAADLSVRTIRYLESGRTRPRARTREAIHAALDQLTGHSGGAVRGAETPPPAQLPLDHAAFVGRTTVLDALDAIAGGVHTAAGVALISGGPGIGKTALAVHWAHRAREMFPGGQLFADLRGFSPSAAPADPDELVRGFLEALGVDTGRVPRRMADRIGLYRTILTGRRVLIVLDNAVDAAQIRPLLPASAGSMAVVTSRNLVAGLVTADGAHPVPIGPCTAAEGRELLAARLGSARLDSDAGAAEEIVRLCAGLPLALSVVAARAATHPGFSLTGLVADLKTSAGPDFNADVHSTMSWSVAALSEPATQAFRILGLHPYPEITADVIAAADGLGPDVSRRALDELAEANLLTERRPARFAMHDVIHAYAHEVARRDLGPAVRDRIRQRLHQHYADVATAAVTILCPHLDLDEGPQLPASVPAPEIRDAEHAVAVLRTEHDVLHEIVQDAGRRDDPLTLWRLAASLFIFYDRQGHRRALTPLAQHAARAARQLGDHRHRLDAERLSARAYRRNGDKRTARQRLGAAIRLADDAGDAATAAACHFEIGAILDSDDRHAESVVHFGHALDTYRRAGDSDGEAGALNAIGWARLHLGEPELTLDHCRRALVLHGLAGNPHGEASTLDTYGLALLRTGDVGQAIDAYQAALDLMSATGDRHLEAAVLEHLGDAWESSGNLVRARTTRVRALAILDDINPVQGRRLRSQLRRSAA